MIAKRRSYSPGSVKFQNFRVESVLLLLGPFRVVARSINRRMAQSDSVSSSIASLAFQETKMAALRQQNDGFIYPTKLITEQIIASGILLYELSF